MSGPASVIEAIAMGRQAASSMDRYLGGSGLIEETLAPTERPELWLGHDEGFACWRRVETSYPSSEQRMRGFTEVRLGLDKEAAIGEAKRCLRCNLRLKVPATRRIQSSRVSP